MSNFFFHREDTKTRKFLCAFAPLRFLFFFFLFSFFFFFGCKNSLEEIKEVATSPSDPAETAKEVEMFYSDSGIVKFKLIAGRLERKSGEEPITEFFDGVKIIFFDDSMKSESEMQAQYAIHYEKEEKMIAKNNVVVVNVKGETLNTEELTWEQQKHLVYTDVFVKITTADETIFGDGLESNEDFSKYKIKKIKGTINRK